MKKAIIDLGTNTFQLLIVEQAGTHFELIHEDSYAAKIGKGGISQGIITPEGIERAIAGLNHFKEIWEKEGILTSQVLATATSAVRNAKNGEAFCQAILDATGINIQVISGEEEAGLIYEGVKLGTHIGKTPSMIMDIGGGSVEFIICDQDRIYWKQSFEIGGQRLMDKFMNSDPISPRSVGLLRDYLEEQLLPLTNAVHQYAPECIIGSAGSFETLVDMYSMKHFGEWPPRTQVSFELPITDFYDSFLALVSNGHNERMAIPGMIELRVDMIVVGVCLIDFVLKRYDIQQIKVSTYALKEGILSRLLSQA
ncbi:Ppx/GppA phosphatase family protein [Flectobacillus major]|jgi:exopolyphosphatase/guanosine-5'-triphosphate,3'-diphosphate pyrophosphatase|uniref:Ppx/GppA phosphatase family protein n=1 Tax=Flectobacillus major TaxID=103 RepID=UPI0004244F19|nr:phosphatase [Flectobacillus major]